MPKNLESLVVLEPVLNNEESEVIVDGVPDRPGVAASIFEAVASKEVMVNLIVQGVGKNGKSKITFTIPSDKISVVKEVLEEVVESLGAENLSFDPDISIVSVEGIGMKSYQSVASAVFKALADAGINIDVISTSETKISVVVKREDGEKAVKVIKDAFESMEVEIEKI